MVYEYNNTGVVHFLEKLTIPHFSDSKKGATMLKSVSKWNMLLLLNDKGVSIHKLDSLERVGTLPNSAGASCMAVDEDRHMIVASIKKKMMVYQLRDGLQVSQTLVKEIILPDPLVCMSFLNSLLFVGTKKQYCLVDLDQGRVVKDICEISKSTNTPFCTPIVQKEGTYGSFSDETDNDTREQGEMLLANDRKGLFYDFVGSPARGKGQHLEWSSDAVNGVYLCPYFIVSTTAGIEIHNSWRYQRIQVIPFSSTRAMEVAHLQVEDSPADGVVICSQSAVVFLKMLPLQEQINILISDKYKNFDDALTLCNLFPKGKETIRDQFKTQISRLKGLYLFSEGKYDKAIAFLQRGQVPIRQVLSLYPSIIPDDLPKHISPFPKREFASPVEENVAIDALLPLLHSRRQQLIMKLKQVESFKDTQTSESGEPSESFSSVVFLSMNREDESQLRSDLSLIDSVLLRAYIRSDRQAIIPFLEGVNYGSFEDSQSLLASAGMEPELIVLYSTHHKHDLAIAQILSPLSQSTLSSTERQKRLADLMHYLQKLGCDYKELIFDCSRMFYKESRSLVLELFSGYEPVDGGEPIQNEEILAHLHELSEKDPTLQHPWEKNALEITFLRNLIWTKNETNSAFHTKLVFLYMSSISSLEDNVQTLEQKIVELQEQEKSAEVGSDLTVAEAGLQSLLLQRKEMLVRSKTELLEFLELSNYYNASELLRSLPDDSFLEEKAIILSKLGEDLAALEIIAHRLGNRNMAESYCQRVWDSGRNRSIFLHLIKTYLFPPDHSTLSREECIQLAIRVLTDHMDKVDVVEVLRLLPDDVTLNDLVESMETVMTKLEETRRSTLMLSQLATVRRLDVGEEYTNLRNLSFENTATTYCPVCRRAIGESVFTCFPDGTMLHAACARQYSQEL